MYRSHVLVCGGTGCTSSGSQKIMETLRTEIAKAGLDKEVSVVQTGCHGLCALGPIMIVYPEAVFYSMVKDEDIPEIVSEHLVKGRVVKRLVYEETVTDEGIKSLADTNFYKKQHRIALRNCGVINPENIDEYIGTRGYEALGKVLTSMTPDEVIQVILDSGLRGRGGAGFRSWLVTLFRTADRSMFAVTLTRVTPVHSWTVRFLKAILMQCSRLWLSQDMLSALHRVTSMYVLSTLSLYSV